MEQFNSSFYAAAATVIPVLYIAIIIQDKWFLKTLAKLEKNNSKLFSKAMFLYLVFFAGTVGEISAFLALYNLHANHTENVLVWFSLLILIIMLFISSAVVVLNEANKR
jgi:hypothetical protein